MLYTTGRAYYVCVPTSINYKCDGDPSVDRSHTVALS